MTTTTVPTPDHRPRRRPRTIVAGIVALALAGSVTVAVAVDRAGSHRTVRPAVQAAHPRVAASAVTACRMRHVAC